VYVAWSGVEQAKFFGFGNDTTRNSNLAFNEFYDARQNQVVVNPLIEVPVIGPLRARTGLLFKHVWSVNPSNGLARHGMLRRRKEGSLGAASGRKPALSALSPRQERAAARAERPVPNYLCYPEAFKGRVDEHGNWLGGKVPKCRKCGGNLQPKENHVCPGFIPKYSELPLEERRARRECKLMTEGEWDDDQYDPTTPGEIIRDPDEEDSGVVIEGMTEEEWLLRKFGYIPPCP
jgi:hypothetical protein